MQWRWALCTFLTALARSKAGAGRKPGYVWGSIAPRISTAIDARQSQVLCFIGNDLGFIVGIFEESVEILENPMLVKHLLLPLALQVVKRHPRAIRPPASSQLVACPLAIFFPILQLRLYFQHMLQPLKLYIHP